MSLSRPVAEAIEEARPAAVRIPSVAEPHALYFVSKRTIDLLLGLVFLLLAAPVILVAALAIAVTMRAWPFFSQMRVGEGGREFRMFKICSMLPGSDAVIPLHLNISGGPTFKSDADPRVTRVGRIIRRTSIDELPQLLNVVLGNMSLVGPRPALPREVIQYPEEAYIRLSVKPGLTCFWQTQGRSLLQFDEWMRLDRQYVETRSLGMDLKLLLRTPLALISMKGAY
ncbi:MAG: sugar transferase [Dehalococcoidia bacterium]